MDPITDLAVRSAAGDRDALEELVRRTQADVWRMCAHVVDRQAADDLTQETFIRLMGAVRNFRGESAGRTFVLAVARHTCLDELRRRSRRQALTGRLTAQRRAEDDQAPDIAGAVALDRLVAALDPERREAFVCTQVLGLSYAEAADVCGCPVGTIRSRVARARDDLVRRVDADGEAEAAGGERP